MAVSAGMKRARDLVQDMRESKGNEACQKASMALWESTFDRLFLPSLIEAGVVCVVVNSLREWDSREAAAKCALAVGNLCHASKERQVAFAKSGILPALVAQLPNDPDNHSPATTALYHITTNNAEVTRQLRDIPDVISALEMVKAGDRYSFAKDLIYRLRQ